MFRTQSPASSFICIMENSENNHLLLSEIVKGRVIYLHSVASKVIFAVIFTAPSSDFESKPKPSIDSDEAPSSTGEHAYFVNCMFLRPK